VENIGKLEYANSLVLVWLQVFTRFHTLTSKSLYVDSLYISKCVLFDTDKLGQEGRV
jgi:hypothetical protein